MTQFLISTTGVVTLTDLGNRILPSGLNSIDIGTEFRIEELRYSTDLISAIESGILSVVDDGRGRSIIGPVSNSAAIEFVSNIYHYDDTDVSSALSTLSIENLGDVSLSSPILDGESLIYNSTLGLWENQSINIIASQVSDFDTASETAIFTNANFVDSTTIDFMVNVGSNVTAEVIANSISANELNITGNGTAGQYLASDADGSFTWTNIPESKKSWSWGAASTSNNNTNRYIDQFDGVSTNIAPYVAFFACELRAISFSTNVASTWTAEIHKNGVQVATLSSGGLKYGQITGLSITFAAGDRIGFYVNGTGVNTPAINALFEEV